MEAELFSSYHDVELMGTDAVEEIRVPGPENGHARSLSREQVATMVSEALHSYPEPLMRGLAAISARRDRKLTVINGNHYDTYGNVTTEDGGQTVNLFVAAIATEIAQTYDMKKQPDEFLREFEQFLRAVLYHELAHVAHRNAPVAWLREWEKLNHRHPISLNGYTEITRQHNADEGRIELFAVAAETYRTDPLQLMRTSRSHFLLMNELLDFYDIPSVVAAYDLIKTGATPDSPAYTAIQRRLEDASAKKLQSRIEHTAQHGSPLGRAALAGVSRPKAAA
jgi:hypothetical protein